MFRCPRFPLKVLGSRRLLRRRWVNVCELPLSCQSWAEVEHGSSGSKCFECSGEEERVWLGEQVQDHAQPHGFHHPFSSKGRHRQSLKDFTTPFQVRDANVKAIGEAGMADAGDRLSIVI